jgi:hypothetical protein
MAITKKTYSKYTQLKDEYEAGLITLNNVKLKIVSDLEINTYNYVITYMPEWRQLKWDKYIGLHEKITSGSKLSDYESQFYNSFPEDSETYSECYINALKAMAWISLCTQKHDEQKTKIMQATDIEKVVNMILPDYPKWVL